VLPSPEVHPRIYRSLRYHHTGLIHLGALEGKHPGITRSFLPANYPKKQVHPSTGKTPTVSYQLSPISTVRWDAIIGLIHLGALEGKHPGITRGFLPANYPYIQALLFIGFTPTVLYRLAPIKLHSQETYLSRKTKPFAELPFQASYIFSAQSVRYGTTWNYDTVIFPNVYLYIIWNK
jgi:hypothetical protein